MTKVPITTSRMATKLKNEHEKRYGAQTNNYNILDIICPYMQPFFFFLKVHILLLLALI